MESEFDWLAFGYGFATAIGLMLLFLWLRPGSKQRNGPMPPSGPVVIPQRFYPQIRLLRAEGREVDAVKLVRKVTGCDLKSAQDAVKALR